MDSFDVSGGTSTSHDLLQEVHGVVEQSGVVSGEVLGSGLELELVGNEVDVRSGVHGHAGECVPLTSGLTNARGPTLGAVFGSGAVQIPVGGATLISEDGVDGIDAAVCVVVEVNALNTDVDEQFLLLTDVPPVHDVSCVLAGLGDAGDVVESGGFHVVTGAVLALQSGDVVQVVPSDAVVGHQSGNSVVAQAAVCSTDDNLTGGELFLQMVDEIRAIGEKAAAAGLTLLYHNHDFEFDKLENGQCGIDYLYENVPAEYLQTELDQCWVKYAGYEPVEYLQKYSGRSPVVHLKDYYASGEQKEDPYALIGLNEGEKKENKAFEFRPLGYGVQDIPAIIEASKKAGSKWFVVEQDQPSLGKTPMECAGMSMEYLKSLKK